MNETEIEFLKRELCRGAKIIWCSSDGMIQEIAGIVRSYKENGEEIAGPIDIFSGGGYANIMNATLDEFHFMMPVTEYY